MRVQPAPLLALRLGGVEVGSVVGGTDDALVHHLTHNGVLELAQGRIVHVENEADGLHFVY